METTWYKETNQKCNCERFVRICLEAGRKSHRARCEMKAQQWKNGPWCQISLHYAVNSHPTKALSSAASLRSHPQHFIIFPAFWIAVTMGTAGGREGAGSADMNRPTPRHVLVGSSHGSGIYSTHLMHSKLPLSKKSVTFGLIEGKSELKREMFAKSVFCSPQVTSSTTSLTCYSTRSWVNPGSFSFITWW